MAVPLQSPRHKLTKLHNYALKTLQQFIQTDKSNNKAHTLTIKLSNNSDISLVFCLFLSSVVLASMASHANLHKRREALARCYVTSHWQAEWVKKRNWKTIETPPPSWLGVSKAKILEARYEA